MRKVINVILSILVILLLTAVGLYQLMNARSFQVAGDLTTKVDTEKKVVALTLDDGPSEKTEEILQILDNKNVKATFFLNGNMMKKFPAQLDELVQSGHELGNHSYSHDRMVLKSYSWVRKEVEKTDELLRNAGYEGAIHFRPPYGKKLFTLPLYLNNTDRKTIMWSIEPDTYADISGDATKIIDHVSHNIEPGSIILMHVMYDNDEKYSLEAIEGMVDSLRKKGYTFKTVSELLENQRK
ncbi:polysaccharide deacetylase family protein [Pontibacillus marinus]|uniref:Polysaccharide deacetylase n=1 Tax=Pontibacillus marinus BH030004 = DSM 16465 TaxID=1385511 RepID=A0A0A5GE38_9BACI|nr:polysaccharide deacetylase family protein [Pontibacillus marinus]KGX90274.1 polysaccharide deacetylase [Pontibacillus marinus BH030004 = DSM 16465]